MKRHLLLLFGLMLALQCIQAQSKVFKEISEDISSKMEPIIQDRTLVGYLVFTQLEKASEDSFNYKISIMDENLNDIGTVNFREENLDLQAVSFEGDVICMAYLKSDMIGKEFKNYKTFNAEKSDAKNAVLTQFIGLDGKIIKQNITSISIELNNYFSATNKLTASGSLGQDIQLRNIPQEGFACFYGDDKGKKLFVYNTKGDQVWKKDVSSDAFTLMATPDYLYLLGHKSNSMVYLGNHYELGGYKLFGFGIKDSVSYPEYALKDNNGNGLYCLTFSVDPVTSAPYIAGYIYDPKRGYKGATARQRSRGTFSGVFTLNINGPKKSDIKGAYSYWGDRSMEPEVSKKGKFSEFNSYADFSQGIRDYNGNTYFVGSLYKFSPKWSSIILSIVTIPTLITPPILIGALGTAKFKITDAIIVKQDAKGGLAVSNSIQCDHSRGGVAKQLPLSALENKSFYSVNNTDSKANYLILDDQKNIYIYNINDKKIAKTIAHKEGKITTYVFPAKEGHVMVVEYNKKEKYTRLSIEAL